MNTGIVSFASSNSWCIGSDEELQAEMIKSCDRLPTAIFPKSVDLMDLQLTLKIIPKKQQNNGFTQVTFPEGWSMEKCERKWHTILKDPRGNKRGTIFYRPNQDTREPYMDLHKRYECRTVCVVDKRVVAIVDNKHNRIIYTAGRLVDEREEIDGVRFETDAIKWLDKQFPFHEDPFFYWDSL